MKRWIITGLACASLAPLATVLPASAFGNNAAWNGNGTDNVDEVFLDTEICGIENGAPVDGPYAYWVLTASRASAADITIDGGSTFDMTKHGRGSFHFLQEMNTWDEPDYASATYDGSNDKRVNLVLEQGCTESLENIG